MKRSQLILLLLLAVTTLTAQTLPALHVAGHQLADSHGNTVVLHGVMDTPNPYFNNYRWTDRHWVDLGKDADKYVSACIAYFDKLYAGLTDQSQGAYCNVFRLHLDPCWTNDPTKESKGENDISAFSESRLRKYLTSLYVPLMEHALRHGLYVVVRPPGVFPQDVKVGDSYNKYLMTVWDIVSQNATVKKYAGQIMFELGNEPVNLLAADGKASTLACHDFFQPIVDKIRQNGYTGVLWIPGTGWQQNYRNYATHPITGYNIGYAVHDYPGWYGCSDDHADSEACIKAFRESVPVVDTNPVIITEVDWSPEKPGEGHYNEHGDWVPANYGTWATASTSKWGKAYKALLDHYGNLSMTLSSTSCYLNIDMLINQGKVVPAFKGVTEACGEACFQWYKDYAKVNQPRPDFTRTFTADQGDGTFRNPIINADFPDASVIRVGDWYYMATTSMFYLPGATILKSRDLVNWSYCANPLEQIADDDAFNLRNHQSQYSKGQWAPSLKYHDGTFYLHFIAFGYGDFLLTATDPEGPWTARKLGGFYYDSDLLFDGDKIYIVHGNGKLSVTELNEQFEEVTTKEVFAPATTVEGSHFYHIGDYYYIYSTYPGEGSQTVLRSKHAMGPYEEHSGRLFATSPWIHQGSLIETQAGEWWTILHGDDWSRHAIGRQPYLEPVTWKDGWPVIGVDGKDCCDGGKAYAKPNVGTTWPTTVLPTNDTFTDARLGMQWQWNHNADASAWSLIERPGWLRLHTSGTADSLQNARNTLTQRIFDYGTDTPAMGTVKLDVSHLAEGNMAGLSIFQDQYAMLAVRVKNGQRQLVWLRNAFADGGTNAEARETVVATDVPDVVYLRGTCDFRKQQAEFSYSTDNASWKPAGDILTMRYSLRVFTGNRFAIFCYATGDEEGYADVDWFSTEPMFAEETFYAPGTLHAYSREDLTMTSLRVTPSEAYLFPGGSATVTATSVAQSGLESAVTASCIVDATPSSVVTYSNGSLHAVGEGQATVTVSYTDFFGNTRSVTVPVTVEAFPLRSSVFNPSIWENGSFDEATHTLKTGTYGFGGWKYSNPLDLTPYKYIVVKMKQASSCGASFRLFDEDNYWSSAAMINLDGKTTIQIPLATLTKDGGAKLDLSHVYIAGIWSYGGSDIVIDRIFLSNDGINATDIDLQSTSTSTTAYYNMMGMRISRPGSGVTIIVTTDANGHRVTKKILQPER